MIGRTIFLKWSAITVIAFALLTIVLLASPSVAYTPRIARNAKAAVTSARGNAYTGGVPDTTHWIDRSGSYLSPKEADSENAIKIVSYNTLGPLHGESSKHNYADVKVVRWTRRRDKLLSEIRSFEADFLCLQEVDPEPQAELTPNQN